MTEIDELERRIAAALDRIAKGVEGLERRPEPAPEADDAPVAEDVAEPAAPSETAADPEEIARLTAALEDERLANQQLEERLQGLREKQERQVAGLQEQVAAAREAFGQLDAELQRLRQANTALESTVEDLTRALAENVGEPDLINKAMQAELESLRATRAADDAEARAVLGALTPLLAEAAGDTPPSDAADGGAS